MYVLECVYVCTKTISCLRDRFTGEIAAGAEHLRGVKLLGGQGGSASRPSGCTERHEVTSCMNKQEGITRAPLICGPSSCMIFTSKSILSWLTFMFITIFVVLSDQRSVYKSDKKENKGVKGSPLTRTR